MNLIVDLKKSFGSLVVLSNTMQQQLSRFQIFPILGPLMVSPFKICLGLAQVVAGLIVVLFSQTVLVPFYEESRCWDLFWSGLQISLSGGYESLYALFNVATFGIPLFGWCFIFGGIEKLELDCYQKNYW